MSEITNNAPITVAYWSIRGLGAPLRQMVMYAGVPLNCVNYDLKTKPEGGYSPHEWFDTKPALKAKNSLMNLPYIMDGDKLISQSNACFVYLGKRLNMLGSSEDEEMECHQLLCEIMDLRNKVTGVSYPGDQEKFDAFLKDIEGKNGILQKLELWLEQRITEKGASGTFLVGEKASAPDFHLYEMLVQCTALSEYTKQATPFLTTFPRLAFFFKSFEALPGNAKYLSSKIGSRSPLTLPFNQKMANFGGTLELAPVDAAAYPAYEFGTYSGMY